MTENDDDRPSTITITFDRSDSVNHKVDLFKVHPNQLFVAAEICRQMGIEYFERQRMTEEINRERNALVVAREIAGLKQ